MEKRRPHYDLAEVKRLVSRTFPDFSLPPQGEGQDGGGFLHRSVEPHPRPTPPLEGEGSRPHVRENGAGTRKHANHDPWAPTDPLRSPRCGVRRMARPHPLKSFPKKSAFDFKNRHT